MAATCKECSQDISQDVKKILDKRYCRIAVGRWVVATSVTIGLGVVIVGTYFISSA